MSAVPFGHGLDAGSWTLSVRAVSRNDATAFVGQIRERGSRKVVSSSEARDRESAAFLALQGYVSRLRALCVACPYCERPAGHPCANYSGAVCQERLR